MTPFSQIYRENIWRGTDSLSGPGSGIPATTFTGHAIVDLVFRMNFRSILDVGCGDGFWMPSLPGYVGIDPTPEAIARARENHPDRAYLLGDIRTVTLQADLVIVRDVMQHLAIGEAQSLLAAAFARGKFVLASTYKGGKNEGIDEGRLLKGWAYDIDLEQPPFSLPLPAEYIVDGYDYLVAGQIRDASKFLGLWPSNSS